MGKLKTAEDIAQEIKLANFHEMINPILDRIDFISVQQAPQVFAQLDVEKALLEQIGAIFLERAPQVFAQFLAELKKNQSSEDNEIDTQTEEQKQQITLLSDFVELLDPRNFYAEEEHVQLLNVTVIERLCSFINSARSWSQQELENYIVKQHALRAEKHANAQLPISTLKNKILEQQQTLSDKDREAIADYGISSNIGFAEIKVCIAAHRLFNVAANSMEDQEDDSKQIDTLQQDFNSLLTIQLGFDQTQVASLMQKYLDHKSCIAYICTNILENFDTYQLSLNTFLTLDPECKTYLLFKSEMPLAIINFSNQGESSVDPLELQEKNPLKFFTTEANELNFCIKCLNLYSFLEKSENSHAESTNDFDSYFILNASEVQNIQHTTTSLINTTFNTQFITPSCNQTFIMQTLINAVKICMRDRFTLEDLMHMDDALKNNILTNPELMLNFIRNLSVSKELFQEISYMELFQLNNYKQLIIKLCTEQNLRIEQLLKLRHGIRMFIIINAHSIIPICKDLDIMLVDLITKPVSILEIIFANIKNLQTIKLINNFYFIPINDILALEPNDLQQLIAQPSTAVAMFNQHLPIFSADLLFSGLEQHLDNQLQRLNVLANNMFLHNLTKFTCDPEQLISTLQQAGLPFFACRALYQALNEINTHVANSYLDYFKTTSYDPEDFNKTFNLDMLRVYLDPKISKVLIESLFAYVSNCLAIIERAKGLLNDFSNNELNEYAPNIMQIMHKYEEPNVDPVLIAAKTVQDLFLTVKKQLNTVSTGSKSAKQLVLLKSIAESKYAKIIQSTKSNGIKQVLFAKEALINLKQYSNEFTGDFKTAKFIDINSEYAENSICAAIRRGNCAALRPMLANENLIHRLSNKGLSYYAFAVNFGDQQVLNLVTDWSRVNSNRLLSEFLLTNDFAEIESTHDNGNTPLHLAIANCDYQVTLALLVRGAQFNRPNAHGQTAMQFAIAFGQAHVLFDMQAQAACLRQDFYPAAIEKNKLEQVL